MRITFDDDDADDDDDDDGVRVRVSSVRVLVFVVVVDGVVVVRGAAIEVRLGNNLPPSMRRVRAAAGRRRPRRRRPQCATRPLIFESRFVDCGGSFA